MTVTYETGSLEDVYISVMKDANIAEKALSERADNVVLKG